MLVDARVVLLVEDDKTMYTMETYQRKDGLSPYQNSTSLSAFGSILKKTFWEPVSVDARVVLLVEDDKNIYTMATNVSTKRWTLTLPKFDKPFGVRFHFEKKKFLGIASVDVRVILLVGYDKTMYMSLGRVKNSLGLGWFAWVWTTWLSFPFIKKQHANKGSKR